MNNLPLVSIVVITYNSSKYVLETLESIKAQTYQNIELIISDDCSMDDTVEICKDWINKNNGRFVRSELLTIESNTGVSANCNRGCKVAKGEWIKLIAGDDLLFSDAICEYISFVKTTHCEICCCKLKLFGEDEKFVLQNEQAYVNYYKDIDKDLKAQQQIIIKRLFIPGPGLFFSKTLYNFVEGFDEEYPFCEEWPFMVKILDKKNRIYFVNKYLVHYRIGLGSLCRNTLELNMNIKVFNDVKKFFYKERLSRLIKVGNIFHAWHIHLHFLYTTFLYKSNKKSFFFTYIKYILLFSPLAYLNWIRRKWNVLKSTV
ncbi:MAG: glycosyltransferase [Bacteroidales bacterium]|jgi:alpha-1,3-rhamnosyltransferase|nr:glycosyltransferase [Bacteroidales bacterium]